MSEEIVSTSWHSYPKSHAIGHAYISTIFLEPVIIEEKIDGSQFSFGVFDGDLKCRSKSAQINMLAPEKMFAAGIDAVKDLAPLLTPGWTYRTEYLQKPKHNTLAYARIPNKHVIGFDINTGHEVYLSYEEKRAEFARLGLECVPMIYEGKIDGFEMFRDFLKVDSCLGEQKIEGVVVKNYNRFLPDGHAMMGKFVSEEFKEVHGGEWRERNPGRVDFVLSLINKYSTPARWNKAIFRLRDAGELEHSPRDIGKLIAEIPNDVLAECESEIRDDLFEHFWPQLRRALTGGFPQFYKEKLARDSFENEPETTN